MPASFEIDPVRRLVRSRAWGVVVDADFVATQAGLRLDPDFEPSFGQLYDFREVTEIRVTGDGLFNLSRTSPFAIDARRAFVVGTDVAF